VLKESISTFRTEKLISTFVLKKYLAGAEGLEPSHAGIKIQCLNQLGDAPTLVIGQNFSISTNHRKL
jgi:hypothetical protein